MANSGPIIGVLALQGDFDAHRRRLEELGADVVLVRKVEDFDNIDGLVINPPDQKLGQATYTYQFSVPAAPGAAPKS